MNKININKIITVGLFIIITIFIIQKLISPYYFVGDQLEINYIPGEENDYVVDFASSEEIKLIGEEQSKQQFQVVSQDASVISLNLPKFSSFSKANIEVLFQNPDLQEDIFLNYQNESQAILSNNDLFSDLNPDDWFKIEENNLILWQRYPKDREIKDDIATLVNQEPIYSKLVDFLTSLPESEEVLTYNYNFQEWTKLDDYKSNVENLVIEQDLKGEYDLYTYIKDEKLSFNFNIQDFNTSLGPDDIFITLYYQDKEIKKEKYKADKKNIIFSNEPEVAKKIEFSANDLEEGVYKIVFSAPKDIVTSRITTTQNKVVFSRIIYLTEPANLYFYGDNLKFKTNYKKNIQEITIDNQVIKIVKDNKYYFIENLKDLNNIVIPKENLIMESTGFFAFDKNSFFIPKVEGFGESWDNFTNLNNYNYILANYYQPVIQDQWLKSSSSFDLTQEDNNLLFSIYAPGLNKDNKKLNIGAIKIILTK